MCNRIKWKLTTRSWCRPWPPPSDVSSWPVLVSWSGRRIPRVAVVAAPATCAQSLSLVRRQEIGNLAEKVSLQCPVRRQDHIRRKTSVVCMKFYLSWVKIIRLNPPTFMLYWSTYIHNRVVSKEKTAYSHDILRLLRRILEAASWGQWRGYLSGGQNVLGAENRRLWRVGGEILIDIDPFHPCCARAWIVYCRW